MSHSKTIYLDSEIASEVIRNNAVWLTTHLMHNTTELEVVVYGTERLSVSNHKYTSYDYTMEFSYKKPNEPTTKAKIFIMPFICDLNVVYTIHPDDLRAALDEILLLSM